MINIKHSFINNRFEQIAIAITCICFLSFSVFEKVNWKIENKYEIRFSSEEPSGIFKEFNGDMSFDTLHLQESKFNLNLVTASINTGNGLKNRHAKSEDWLDAEKYPNIIFVSQSFSKNKEGFEVKGILDLHGVQREIAIPFTFKNQIFTGSFSVKRLDYNIGKSTGIYSKVSDEIKIDFKISVTKR